MENENLSADSQAGEAQLTSSSENATVGNVADTSVAPPADITNDGVSLKEINEFLGTNYKDKTTALASLKETRSYVGKKKEDIAKEVVADTDGIRKELSDMKKNMFYKDNPDLAPYKALIDSLGSNPAEVVADPKYKDVLDKALGYDKTQKLKTVLETNPHIASSRDKFAQAKDEYSKGNKESAESLITKGVLEALQG